MKNFLKSKRGFSLVELMVVVAIMGTLATIAIPAYNEYRKSAKKTAYRTDMLSLHKGWLAFGVELDSFCERDTSPENASIRNVGMASLQNSKLYGTTPNKNNFIGFLNAAPTNDPCPTVNSVNLYTNTNTNDKIYENNVITGVGCELEITAYKMGVIGHISGESYIPIQVNHNGVVDEHNEVNNPVAGQRVCV